MRTLRRITVGVAGAFAAWVVALVGFGWLGDNCARERAEAHLAKSMRARVSIGALDLGLVLGDVRIDDLRIEREDRGSFRLAVDRVDVDLAPLGLALVQDTVGDVRVRGVDARVSALGVLDLRGGERAPVELASIDLRDARVTLEATSLVPGLARVEVTVDRARAGHTVLRTPLSWLFALEELSARIALPAGVTVRLDYADGVLRLSGGLFGETPLELPFEIPVLEPARELEQLAEMGQRLARALAAEGAERWLRDRLR